ncbi:DUF1223 domain-containing protein [Seohaeicola sp. SP36]|uniref:DUF1223 domain-containing protein n=1 Tax=unclassified Seohaeicola TaxID=2641111 RepID=UPI00237B89E0|nr:MULTISPECIES: DUF1223 domain-containing protein [unclassified Seohaeicola]MDD9706229.1 DUF1223 domain-containing protein [Seohaeicola sp. 4SK31]MDD9734688.1 DUF1223 domain-containing protein [Seohaeicola sp. SP36]
MGRFTTWMTGIVSSGLIATAGMVSAETRPVVVELFTSQGCSSCPPADAFLHELSKRDDVIALALHVDYWDYIGWKDSFAQPAFTQRQKAYAKSGGRRSVYTPQMIIGGQDHVVGTHEEDAGALIKRHAAVQTGVSVTADRDGAGMVTIRAEAQDGVPGPLVVYIVGYSPSQRVEITRGENAGRTVDYANVVTDWVTVGEWDLSAPLMLQAQSDREKPAVVILQHNGTGPIMAAAHLR